MKSDRFPVGITGTPANRPGSNKRRLLLYGHDTVGLGHLRRNLLLAERLSTLPDVG